MGSAEAVALGELVTALEQATLMAKQIPNSNLDQSQIFQIYTSLHSAHHQLSLFLSNHPHPVQQQQQQPSMFLTPPPVPENSVSSTVGGGGGNENDAEPMQVADDDNEAEQNSMTTGTAHSVDGVEERMRDCFIQSKRPKRSLSPSAVAAAAEQRRTYENVVAWRNGSSAELDPVGAKLRSLDLIYQFHG